MGLIPLPDLISYFSTKWEQKVAFFADVFSKNYFLNMFWNIHFNRDDINWQNKPNGIVISPIIDHMKTMFKLFYTTSSFVAVKESTISFKGKVSFRVNDPKKPVKFGTKLFVISDCENGYIYDFIPYFGKEDLIPNSSLLKSTQIVKLLSEAVIMKTPDCPTSGLHEYTDRYFTSPEVATELLNMKCFITGTVMHNRGNLPKNLKKETKNLKKGEIRSQRNEDLLLLSWRDRRVVQVLSSNNRGSKVETTDIPSRWQNRPPTVKPNVVLDYINRMGSVDKSDHFVASYKFVRKTKKWYRKIFFWLLEVAVVNSYILYKDVQENRNNKSLAHREFRLCLVCALVKEKVAARPKKGRPQPPHGAPEERLTGRHFMEKKLTFQDALCATRRV